jgi:hypothetical protein
VDKNLLLRVLRNLVFVEAKLGVDLGDTLSLVVKVVHSVVCHQFRVVVEMDADVVVRQLVRHPVLLLVVHKPSNEERRPFQVNLVAGSFWFLLGY